MAIRREVPADSVLLALRSEGLSFREISKRLDKPLGSVTSRYYRLKGVRHASQVKRDEELRKLREKERIAQRKVRSLAAIQAAIDLRNGISFSIAIRKARAGGASFEMIGTCCGVSKQAVHKKWRSNRS
jgi:transposase